MLTVVLACWRPKIFSLLSTLLKDYILGSKFGAPNSSAPGDSCPPLNPPPPLLRHWTQTTYRSRDSLAALELCGFDSQ